MGQDTNCYYGVIYECEFNLKTLPNIIKMIDIMEDENDMFIYMVDGNYKCEDLTYTICETLYDLSGITKETEELAKTLVCYNKKITLHYVIEDCHVRGLCRSDDEYLFETFTIDGLHKKIDSVVDKFVRIGVKKEELSIGYRFRDSQ